MYQSINSIVTITLNNMENVEYLKSKQICSNINKREIHIRKKNEREIA